MLGSASSSRHEFGSGSCIHPGKCVLVQMALDESALGSGALRLESAARAIGRYIGHIALAPVQLLANQHAASRTAVAVGVRLVGKGAAVKQLAVGLVVDGPVGWGARHDTVAFTGTGMGAAGIARIGHHSQALLAEHLLCGHGHWMKQAVVAWLVSHFMVDDQSSIGVNRRLDIIARRLGTIAPAHRPRILFAFNDCRAAFSIELGGKAVEFTA